MNTQLVSGHLEWSAMGHGLLETAIKMKIWFINGVDNVNWPPYRDWKADVSSVSPSSEQMKGEGLTLETSAFQSLYGGQFTLSTPLINQIFVFHSPTEATPQFL